MSFYPTSSRENAAARKVLSMLPFTPSILFKAWSSLRTAAVIAFAVVVLTGVMGSTICTWSGQAMIRLKEGTSLEVERMAKLITSLKQLANLLMPGWWRTWIRLQMSTNITCVAWLWYDNIVDIVVMIWKKTSPY